MIINLEESACLNHCTDLEEEEGRWRDRETERQREREREREKEIEKFLGKLMKRKI